MLIVVIFTLAGLGNQGRSKAMGVEPVMRVENNFPISLRSASLFVKSRHVAIRAVIRKTSWKGELSTEPKENARCERDTHVKDLDERVDPPTLSIASPHVSLADYILQQRGKDWNKNEAEVKTRRFRKEIAHQFVNEICS